MTTFKITANIATGDETTAAVDLTFKIYDNGVLYSTVGSHVSDANVTLTGTTVEIRNVSRTPNTAYKFSITQVDEAGNEALISNVYNITSGN